MIKLTLEQEKAIKLAVKRYGKEKTIDMHTKKFFYKTKWISDYNLALNELSIEELCGAIHFGYELEETKEKWILIKYNNSEILYDKDNSSFYKQGIEDALNALEIKIKGINE